MKVQLVNKFESHFHKIFKYDTIEVIDKCGQKKIKNK